MSLIIHKFQQQIAICKNSNPEPDALWDFQTNQVKHVYFKMSAFPKSRSYIFVG